MKSKKFILSILIFSALAFNFLYTPVKTAGICDYFPCNSVVNNPDGSGVSAGDVVKGWILTGLDFVFIAIIIFGVYKVIKAAITIIRADSDAGKVEAGRNIIKGVYLGLAIIFIGIIGIVVITVFFESNGVLNSNITSPTIPGT